MTAYDRCLGLYNELNQLHFELLLLAYGAYLTFFQFCQQAFPDMGMQVDDADDRRLRHDDVPPRRRAEGARRGGARARRRRLRSPTGRTPEEVLAELGDERGGPRLDRRSRVAQAPVVLHVDGRRLLPPPPRLGRRPAAAVHGDHRLHRADPRGHEPRPPEGAAARRARADRERVLAAARDADEERKRVRGDARPLPPRVPARRGPQVLHRALGHLAVLQQDARDRRRDGRARLLRERRRRLLPQHPRGARGALRPRARVVGRHGRARHGLLAAAGRAAQGDPRAARPSGRRRRRSASCPR